LAVCLSGTENRRPRRPPEKEREQPAAREAEPKRKNQAFSLVYPKKGLASLKEKEEMSRGPPLARRF